MYDSTSDLGYPFVVLLLIICCTTKRAISKITVIELINNDQLTKLLLEHERFCMLQN